MYTSHGHQIPGTPVEEPKPDRIMRCGGTSICPECALETGQAIGKQMSDSTMDADFPTIGPEAFSNKEKTVVCWKGQEYVKTCGEFVKNLPDGSQAFCTLTYDHPGSRHINTHHMEENDSNLVEHARRELELIGEDRDIIEWYLDCIRAFVAYGHSGGSSEATLPVLKKLLEHEHLSALTDDPDEWYHHSAEMWDGKKGIWQNKRNTKMFSSDQGKTYFDVENPSATKQYTHPKETSRQRPSGPRAEYYG